MWFWYISVFLRPLVADGDVWRRELRQMPSRRTWWRIGVIGALVFGAAVAAIQRRQMTLCEQAVTSNYRVSSNDVAK